MSEKRRCRMVSPLQLYRDVLHNCFRNVGSWYFSKQQSLGALQRYFKEAEMHNYAIMHNSDCITQRSINIYANQSAAVLSESRLGES